MSNDFREHTPPAQYFSSPEDAVPIIADLLRNQDFKTLAAYYDLSGSAISIGDLESGDFFTRREHPELAHSAGFWRFKQPFAPGFGYVGTSRRTGTEVYLIQLEIKIDQGLGSPVQVGRDSFYMIRSSEGWRLVPDQVVEQDAQETPQSAPDPTGSRPSNRSGE